MTAFETPASSPTTCPGRESARRKASYPRTAPCWVCSRWA